MNVRTPTVTKSLVLDGPRPSPWRRTGNVTRARPRKTPPPFPTLPLYAGRVPFTPLRRQRLQIPSTAVIVTKSTSTAGLEIWMSLYWCYCCCCCCCCCKYHGAGKWRVGKHEASIHACNASLFSILWLRGESFFCASCWPRRVVAVGSIPRGICFQSRHAVDDGWVFGCMREREFTFLIIWRILFLLNPRGFSLNSRIFSKFILRTTAICFYLNWIACFYSDFGWS